METGVKWQKLCNKESSRGWGSHVGILYIQYVLFPVWTIECENNQLVGGMGKCAIDITKKLKKKRPEKLVKLDPHCLHI